MYNWENTAVWPSGGSKLPYSMIIHTRQNKTIRITTTINRMINLPSHWCEGKHVVILSNVFMKSFCTHWFFVEKRSINCCGGFLVWVTQPSLVSNKLKKHRPFSSWNLFSIVQRTKKVLHKTYKHVLHLLYQYNL